MNCKNKLIAIAIFLFCICLTACGKTPVDNSETYGAVVAGLGDEEAYAFLVMDTVNHVLVTSDLLYDTGTEKQASVCCNVYYYASGKVTNAGKITGEGTAYPLRFSKSGIYTASNHSAEKYAVSEKDGLLYLECGIYESFDTSGNASYIMIKGEEKTASTEAAYTELMKEYDSSRIIHFSYGASGSVNEILQ